MDIIFMNKPPKDEFGSRKHCLFKYAVGILSRLLLPLV